MEKLQDLRSFRRFAVNLFLIGRTKLERDKAKEEVDRQLSLMRKSIIRMKLSYSDINRLTEKIAHLIDWERKYSKYFKIEDRETKELRSQVHGLEQEILNEREDKARMAAENSAKIQQLNERLENIKSRMNELLLERAHRHQRLTALDNKIREKVDIHRYYYSHNPAK